MSLTPDYRPAEPAAQHDNFGVDWVVHYQFDDIGMPSPDSQPGAAKI